MKIGELVQESDWKTEKHVPVIDCPDTVKADEFVEVTVSIGKEIAHPNTTEHHINWISVYFQAEGEKFPQQIGRYEFNAHGASAQGPNTSTIYTNHKVATWFKTSKPGTLIAVSMCNIHGLWESSKAIKL
ncbi:MAG: class II SORL domain-containing protein [Candidatus Bathyarchaeota archaeon]|nr:class II SORL domain-containing protein [Candidatus Bathyarchaeota archaeon]